ncbi:DNA polymerase IV [Segetibacter sp. 3557_3]|uniref:DNA polymerase IV n=1 Tax=Segetibacter sp. 3557_3 TaxID=2547429 RepID=UPI001058F444|nr:DNA polymerase IV [Segetibacter sp. 3557_3]TDH24177.1 DNA polymerase IV [Segetibacter sp. 3557_3]
MNINRHIAHFDLDSFFVSVELLKNSKLRGKPIAIGGQSDRGVITCCSYEARKFGVHSAMPVKLARRLCPQLQLVRGDMDSYSKHSRLVTEIVASQVPLFEKSSIDEFYIDMTGMDRFYGCARYTVELRKTIERESGLNVSYGLSSNKLISKVATNEAKPHGQLQIAFGEEKGFLAPLAIEKMPMVGAKTSELLRRMGVETISILSQIPVEMMVNLLGKNGIALSRKANGIDETPIVPYHEQRSIGTEHTFETDTIDVQALQRDLARLTEKIAFELRSTNKLTGCVTVKIRYSDFQTETMQSVIPYTAADHVLLTKAKELFTKLYKRRQLLRLIGVRFSHLIPGNYQTNLFEDTHETVNLYQAIDSIKQQFGEQLLTRAAGFTNSKRNISSKK